MIDKCTNMHVICHFVVFASFIVEDLILCVFLGLLHIEEEKKNVCITFETLTKSMNE